MNDSQKASLLACMRACWEEIVPHLARLQSALFLCQDDMDVLVKEYEAALPRSGLVFHRRRDREGGGPCGLDLCGTIPALKSTPPDEFGRRRKRVQYITCGRMTIGILRKYTKYSHLKHIYFEFDRRRLVLNDEYHVLKNEIARIRKILLDEYLLFAAPSLVFPIWRVVGASPLPPELSDLGSPLVLLIQNVFKHGFELRQLAESYDASPVCMDLSLSFDVDQDHPFGRLRWYHARHVGPIVLHHALLRELHVPRHLIPGVYYFENELRRITALREKYVGKLTRIKLSYLNALACADRAAKEAQPRVTVNPLPLDSQADFENIPDNDTGLSDAALGRLRGDEGLLGNPISGDEFERERKRRKGMAG